MNNKGHFLNILLLLLSVIISLLLGEIVVRNLYPYQIPIQSVQHRIKQYTEPNKSFIRYDPQLGWSPKSSSMSKNKIYAFNEDGIRVQDVRTFITKDPKAGVKRIALFGDSFTMGEDLKFSFTWGQFLEQYLNESGMPTQVLNFGVSAYGMDQAYLRWRTQGKAFRPDTVIFGLQLENIGRNGNLIRALYTPIGIPFSKPRFIVEQDQLRLINIPVLTLDKIKSTLENFSQWPLSEYEYGYSAPQGINRIFLKSRLFVFLKAWVTRVVFSKPSIKEDLADLSLRIILKFKKEVEADGGKFYIVYLPVGKDIDLMLEGLKPQGHLLLEELGKRVKIISPQEEILNKIRSEGKRMYMPNHYTYLTCQIIARHIAKAIIQQKDGANGH